MLTGAPTNNGELIATYNKKYRRQNCLTNSAFSKYYFPIGLLKLVPPVTLGKTLCRDSLPFSKLSSFKRRNHFALTGWQPFSIFLVGEQSCATICSNSLMSHTACCKDNVRTWNPGISSTEIHVGVLPSKLLQMCSSYIFNVYLSKAILWVYICYECCIFVMHIWMGHLSTISDSKTLQFLRQS